MKLTVDIIDDFIKTLDLSGDVRSFSDDGTDTTLIVDNTFHARKGMVLDVDGSPFTIVSIVFETSITVSGLPAAPFNYTVPLPFYFHGTPIATNNQISGANHKDKVPMIYLHEILKEKDKDIFSAVKRDSELRLFFLDSASFPDWTTDDHYSKRLLGLNALVDAFESQALKSRLFFLDETEFSRVNHVKWGTFTDLKGHIKNIFDDELTGVELSLTLPLTDCEPKIITPRLPCPDLQENWDASTDPQKNIFVDDNEVEILSFIDDILQPAWDGSTDPEKNTFVDANQFEILTFIHDGADATSVIARLSNLNLTEEGAIAKFADLMSTVGNFALWDDFYHYGVQLAANTLIGWKSITQTAVNAPTHTPGTGYAFNGSTQYINSNFNPTTVAGNFAAIDGMVGAFVTSRAGSGQQGVLGILGPAVERTRIEYQNTGTLFANLMSSSTMTEPNEPSSGLLSITREGSNGDILFDGVSVAPTSIGAGVLPDSNIIIGAEDPENDGGATRHFNGGISSFVIGASIGFDWGSFHSNLVILNTELAGA